MYVVRAFTIPKAQVVDRAVHWIICTHTERKTNTGSGIIKNVLSNNTIVKYSGSD